MISHNGVTTNQQPSARQRTDKTSNVTSTDFLSLSLLSFSLFLGQDNKFLVLPLRESNVMILIRKPDTSHNVFSLPLIKIQELSFESFLLPHFYLIQFISNSFPVHFGKSQSDSLALSILVLEGGYWRPLCRF